MRERIMVASVLMSLAISLPLVSQQSSAAAAVAGDATRGQALFERRCTGCHALDENREGPHLRGVYGRKAGTVPAFNYSTALRNAGVVWTEENLNRWLTDSDAMIAGSEMGFAVGKEQERADLIAYLKSLR